MTASGCCSKRTSRVSSRSAIWRLVSTMILTSEATVVPKASATGLGAVRWAPLRPFCMRRATLSRLRRRPPLCSCSDLGQRDPDRDGPGEHQGDQDPSTGRASRRSSPTCGLIAITRPDLRARDPQPPHAPGDKGLIGARAGRRVAPSPGERRTGHPVCPGSPEVPASVGDPH